MNVVDRINDRLVQGRVVLIDGGMGSELEARGVPMDGAAWCGVANLGHDQVVRTIHEDYIRAGADIVIANTFAASREPLTAAGVGDRVEEANRRAVRAAMEARENVADRPIAIAGSMSHAAALDTHGKLRPDATPDSLLRSYREQASILADAGVDFLALEMIGSREYGAPALQAAFETGLPVWLGVSLARPVEGSLTSIFHADVDFGELVRSLVTQNLWAVTVMHTDVSNVDPALDAVRRQWEGNVGVYPHVGRWQPPNWIFADISADEFAEKAQRWVARGIQFIGGCCGIGPRHIGRLGQVLAG
jgi:S-methylmethionine-dependent homocysteine/selenocysteine methylase